MSVADVTLTRGTEQQFDLSIGCVPVSLRVTESTLFKGLASRYARFAVASDVPIPICVNCGMPETDFASEFDYEFEGAKLFASKSGAHFENVRNEYALDTLLRVFLSWALLPRSGFLLHASTVVKNGKAYVFMGKSGAGKSTVASMSPTGSVLTDEISLLRRENNLWRAHGTPFWGEFRAEGSNTGAPLAGIFRLQQALVNRATRIRAKEMLRVTLPNVLFFSPETRANTRLLEILGAAAEEIPAYDLAFRKEPAFWEALPA